MLKICYYDVKSFLKIFKKYKKSSLEKNKRITYYFKRSTHILPFMVDFECKIHNGKRYETLKVSSLMVGHKVGEFLQTRVSSMVLSHEKGPNTKHIMKEPESEKKKKKKKDYKEELGFRILPAWYTKRGLKKVARKIYNKLNRNKERYKEKKMMIAQKKLKKNDN